MRKNIKSICLLIIGVFIATPLFATILTITYTNEQPSTLIRSSRWNQNMSDIQTFLNSNQLDSTDNIKAGGVSTTAIANLAVTDAKIAGITTAGKVSGAALTSLSSTPSGAGILPAANTYVGPNFHVTKGGSNQTISTATDTDLTWSTEVYDTNNNFASNTFTPTVAGKYFLDAIVVWASAVDQTAFAVRVRKNGTTNVLFNIHPPSGTASFSQEVSGVVQANGSTDSFTINVNQVSGGNINVDGTAVFTLFQGFYLGP